MVIGVVLSLVVSVLLLAGPGWEASPIRVARRPYRALRSLIVVRVALISFSEVSGIWYGLWSPSSAVKVRGGCCLPCCGHCCGKGWWIA